MRGALCVGLAVHDLTFLVDDHPAENRKIFARETREAGGGPAATAACLLARFGVPVALCATLGDDPLGRAAREELAGYGVDTALVTLAPDEPTGLSAVLVSAANGSRTIVTRRPPREAAHPPAAFARTAPALLLFDGHAPEATRAALAALPGAETVADAGSLRDGARDLWAAAGHLLASERFSAALSPGLDLDTAPGARAALADLARVNGGRTVAVTRGERGCIFSISGKLFRLAAPAVRALDTTAAGDIFHGAYAAALLAGLPGPERFRFATSAAACSVGRPGGRLSIPSREETLAALPRVPSPEPLG